MRLLRAGALSKNLSLGLGHALCAAGLGIVTVASLNGGLALAQESLDTVPIGVVDDVSGKWLRVQDEQPLFRGDLFYEGDTVTIGNDEKRGGIAIVLFAGGQHWEITCSDAAPCSGRYRPPQPSEPRRGFWSFLSSYFKSGRKAPSVLTFGRSAIESGLQHAVIITNGLHMDLRPVLEGLPSGSYELRFNPAPGGGMAGRGSPQLLQITIYDTGPIHVRAIPHGLYLLTVNDVSGKTFGSNVLVLLCGTKDAQVREIWIEAEKAIEAWPRKDMTTKAMFLGHILYALDVKCR